MLLLIDADSAIYKAGMSNEERTWMVCSPDGNIAHTTKYKADAVAWSHENPTDEWEFVKHKEAGPISHSLSNLKKVCDIMRGIPHDTAKFFISGKGNFRYDLYPEYKGNRKPEDRPIHEAQLRDYLIKHIGAETVDDEEADDRVSILQCTLPVPTCIVSIDKDLLNTPGWNYNYDKELLQEITEEQSQLNFAKQLLTGDTTDNIPGITGIGPKKADKLLPAWNPDWVAVVLAEYAKHYGEDAEEIMVRNGRLLWMRRTEGELWDLNYKY